MEESWSMDEVESALLLDIVVRPPAVFRQRSALADQGEFLPCPSLRENVKLGKKCQLSITLDPLLG